MNTFGVIDKAEHLHAALLNSNLRDLAPYAAHTLNAVRDLLRERDELAAFLKNTANSGCEGSDPEFSVCRGNPKLGIINWCWPCRAHAALKRHEEKHAQGSGQ